MNDSKMLRTNAIIATVNSFPTLPAVVARVIEITADPDSDIEDLMKVIEMDQSLTASVLKIANSALYGVARKIGSLKEALTVLGFAEIQKIVLSKAVFESFKHVSGDVRFEFKKFWEHSFYCGISARTIARETGNMYNELFVAGIIHDIGKLILFIALEDDYVKILHYASENEKDLFEIENEVLGTNHSKVAMDLLKRWMFPDKLIMAAGFHHSPLESGNEKIFPIIIHLANLLTTYIVRKKDGLSLDKIEQRLISVEVKNLASIIDIDWSGGSVDGMLNKIERERENEIEILNLFMS